MILRFLRAVLVAVFAAVLILWLFGPREPVVTEVSFDPMTLGDDLDVYLAAAESGFDDLVEGAEKQIVWAAEPGVSTAFSIIYIHGFSASAGEMRPMPDMVADAIGANIYYTRLSGHGRDGEAMAEALVEDWFLDMAEALAIGRAIGERVIVMSTSTGGTISALAALDDAAMNDVAGMVFLSPNFQIKNPMAALLTLPGVRWWGPLVAGQERCFEPQSEMHERIWTNCYPTVATIPMAALVRHARMQDYSQADTPALWIYSRDDQVVDAAASDRFAATWGGPSEVVQPNLSGEFDPAEHVIAGDAVSPSMSGPIAEIITGWVLSL